MKIGRVAKVGRFHPDFALLSLESSRFSAFRQPFLFVQVYRIRIRALERWSVSVAAMVSVSKGIANIARIRNRPLKMPTWWASSSWPACETNGETRRMKTRLREILKVYYLYEMRPRCSMPRASQNECQGAFVRYLQLATYNQWGETLIQRDCRRILSDSLPWEMRTCM